MKLSHLTSLSLLLASASLIGQESTGTLLGSVTNDAGRPVAGARVSITSPVLLQPRVVATDQNGQFRVPILPPGTNYHLTVSASGLLTQRVEGLTISAGVTRRQDVVLKAIVTASATVEITGTSAAVDKTETKISSSFNADEIQALPAPSLNAYGALAMAPGVAGNITYPVIRGAITGQSQFVVNGVSVRDPLVREGRQDENVIDDLIEDIQVIQSPMNARYGFTSGGIVSIVTKTGSNEFHGGVRVKLRNDAWRAGLPDAPERVETFGEPVRYYSDPEDDTLWKTYEINLRGPIWKDHVTFSYAGRFTPPTLWPYEVTNLYRNGRRFNPFYGQGSPGYTYGQTSTAPMLVSGTDKLLTQNYKLFWQIAPTQTLSFEAMVDKSIYFDTQLSGIDIENMMHSQLADSDIRSLQYNGIFGSFVVDLKWGRNTTFVTFSHGPGDPIYQGTWTNRATPNSFFTVNTTANPNGWGTTYLTNGDLGDGIPEHRNTETIDANVQWVLNSHQFDFGFGEYKEMVRGGGYPGINNRIYYVPGRVASNPTEPGKEYVVWNVTGTSSSPLVNTASNAIWRTNGRIPMVRVLSTTNDARQDVGISKSQTIYANDFYTINNHWNVMLGFRYEKYLYDSRLGREIDTSSILPRLTVKYDVLGDNQHVVDFSFGQFRGTIGSGNLGSFYRSPNNRSVNMYWNQGTLGTPSGPGVAYLVDKDTLLDVKNYTPYLYSDSDIGREIDPNLKPEMRTSFTLNYMRSYNSGYFRASAVFDTFSDLWYINIPEWKTFDIPDFANTGLTTPMPAVRRVMTFDPHGERDYRSLEIEWQHRIFATAKTSLTWAGNWTMARIYSTRPWREGNVGDNAAYYYKEWDAMGVPLSAWNPKGELAGVSEHHSIKSWLAYHVGDRTGVQTDLSLMASYVTGRPYDINISVKLPPELMAQSQVFSVINYAQYASFFYGDKRGWFLNQDGPPSFDLKWNMSIPVGKKIEFYSSASIFNVFNHFSKNGFSNRGNFAYDALYTGDYYVWDKTKPNGALPEAPLFYLFPYTQNEGSHNWVKLSSAGNQGRYSGGGTNYNARYLQFDFGIRF